MQCPRCGAIFLKDPVYCHNCGARLTETLPPALPAMNGEANELATVPMSGDEENAPITPPPSLSPQLVTDEEPVPVVSPREPGRAEFGGMQAQGGMPAVPGAIYPSLAPGPGGYVPVSNYSYGTIPTGFALPVTPVPKQRGPWLVNSILGVLVLLLVSGGVFVGIRIGQSQRGALPTQAVTVATSTASAMPYANQLYQQVTSQNPTFVDGLKDPTLSSWAVFEKPTYGCEIQKDGLHVHTRDTARFSYCTSGRGKFSNFAFQVEMKILSGNGGGIVFREDYNGGNLYVFNVYPDGSYHIYMVQNHKATAYLTTGAINSFVSGFGKQNMLTVIAQGSQVYFYVNQKVITLMQDSTFASGNLGVLANDHTTPTEVIYTNAQIWIL